MDFSTKGVLLALLLCPLAMAVSAAEGAIVLSYEEGPNIGQPYTGPVVFKVTNYDESTKYAPGTTGGYSGDPGPGVAGGVAALDLLAAGAADGALPLGQYPGAAGDFLEDGWGIGRVTGIYDPDGSAVWTPAGKGQELTVLHWGLQDFFIAPASGDETVISGAGMQVAMYSNPAGSFDPTGGTVARGPGNTYPGITGGVLELAARSLPGFLNIPGVEGGLATEFRSLFDWTSLSGNGSAFLELTGGASYQQFNTDSILSGNADLLNQMQLDATADLKFLFDTNLSDVADWDVLANDPVSGEFIPEPTTVGLLLLGALAGLSRRGRRR